MAKINDLNLKKWKKYSDILTDSLWIINKRDRASIHLGDYHGNFVPQIPNQLLKRFTKKGDVVLDTFLGSGTSLIECRRLGRSGIGIELLAKIARLTEQRITRQSRLDKSLFTEVVAADSTKKNTRKKIDKILKSHKKKGVQLIIMHPPYHDIIKFSNRSDDLSNSKSVKQFLQLFGKVVANFIDLLENEHFLAVVIGDKYSEGEWIPLGFRVLEKVLEQKKLKLKSILVKNMVNSRAKRNLDNLWRYRALAGNFYIFRHEYILLFQKKK